ncbi:hypothetical protein [Chondromyces apiculatus]|nr:hypothetical protein [Chondromyces apiculatus]
MRHLGSGAALIGGLGLLHFAGGCALVVGADFSERQGGEGAGGPLPLPPPEPCTQDCLATPVKGTSWGNADTQDEARVAVSTTGDVFVALNARGAIDYGGGPMGEPNERSIHVVKLDVSLGHVWSHHLSGSGDYRVTDLEAIADGAVVIVGDYKQGIDIAGQHLENEDGLFTDLWEGFIAVLDADGEPIWTEALRGEGQSWIHSLAVGPDGSLILVGEFSGYIDLDSALSAGFAESFFVIKLDSEGKKVWAHAININPTQPVAVDVGPDGEVVLAGGFKGEIDFDGDSDAPVSSQGGHANGFLVALDAGSGEHRWHHLFQTDAVFQPKDVIVESNRRVLMTGTFSGDNVGFGADLTQSARGQDVFLAAYALDEGTPAWVVTYGGDADDEGLRLVTDRAGGVLLCGSLMGEITLPDEDETRLEHLDGKDGFVIKLGPSTEEGPGALIWASSLRGPVEQVALDVATSPLDQQAYVVGHMDSSFPVEGLERPLAHGGGRDVWLLGFEP